MRSIASLLILTPLLSGCVTGPAEVAAPAACPVLADPPVAVVDALAEAAGRDSAAAVWVVDLNRHYRKLDAC